MRLIALNLPRISMRKFANFFPGFLLLLAGAMACFAAEPLPVGMSRHTISYDGQERSFLVFVPPGSGTKLPVVVAFHGGFGNGKMLARHIRLNAIARRKHFMVVYPEGVDKHWSDGRGTTEGVDDVGFVRSLVRWVRLHAQINDRRVYATGPSNGGNFTQRLACEAPDLFAAFAPVMASMPVELAQRCHPGRPVPVFMISGKDDPLVPRNGGNLTRGKELGGRGGKVISVPDAAAYWAKNNGCGKPSERLLPDSDPSDGTRVEEVRYRQCKDDAEVVLWEVDGGGHTWPGARERPGITRIVGKTSRDIDASAEIWEFFSRHELTGTGTGE